ncbi:hypothetical protein CIB93_14195 [Streptomyces sp. WZ.A104]|nr:hypothetical protein CIB93_14195 [Streptomyces sp. WZ.A104]
MGLACGQVTRLRSCAAMSSGRLTMWPSSVYPMSSTGPWKVWGRVWAMVCIACAAWELTGWWLRMRGARATTAVVPGRSM